MFKFVISFFILCFFTAGSLISQQDTTLNDTILKKDTVCIKYNFVKGDTLLYFIEARDSIIIDYEPALTKHRKEHIRLVCDSIGKNGLYYISQTLVNFNSTESREEIKNVERNTSPWLGRKVQYTMDSLGQRFDVWIGDSTKGAISPAGAFNPLMLPVYGGKCKGIMETWIVNMEFDMPENGIPVPLIRMNYLVRAKEPHDTLNSICNRFEYISTGQGRIDVPTPNQKMEVTSILNGHGTASIDSAHGVLVHHYTTVEQKLTIKYNDSTTKPGLHYISANMTLLDYRFPNRKPEHTDVEGVNHKKSATTDKKNKIKRK